MSTLNEQVDDDVIELYFSIIFVFLIHKAKLKIDYSVLWKGKAKLNRGRPQYQNRDRKLKPVLKQIKYYVDLRWDGGFKKNFCFSKYVKNVDKVKGCCFFSFWLIGKGLGDFSQLSKKDALDYHLNLISFFLSLIFFIFTCHSHSLAFFPQT